MRRASLLLMALIVVAGGCGDDGTPDTTATDDTAATTTAGATHTVATTTIAPATTEPAAEETTTSEAGSAPAGPAFIMREERGAFVRALQVYLDCAGFGPIDIDGVFGDATAGSVEKAQEAEGKEPTGEPSEATFAELSRRCSLARDIVFAAGATEATVAGNAAPGDDEVFHIRVLVGQRLMVTVEGDVLVSIQGTDGGVLKRADGWREVDVEITVSQVYVIRVAAEQAASFSLAITVPALPVETTTTTAPEPDQFLLMGNGFNVVDFGATPEAAIAAVQAALDELGIPIDPPEDTGWVTREEPHCADTARIVTWEWIFPAAISNWEMNLELFFFDEVDPRWSGWRIGVLSFDEPPAPLVPSLSTAQGIGLWTPEEDAVAAGFQFGGYEELSQGRLEPFMMRIANGVVSEIGAGNWLVCDPF